MIISLGRSQMRTTVVALTVAALTVGGAITLLTKTTTAAADDIGIAAVEDEGAGCAVTLPGSLTASSRLPDPFRRINGTRITSKADWRCRRAEIKELAERYVYGDKPAKPATVTGTVSGSNITVNVNHNGRSASFSAGVQLPSGTGPFPAVLVVGGFGADTATIRAAGAAVISYDPLAVGREGTPRNNKQGAFYTIYGNTSSTGLLAAWAWGASRIIDVIEQSGGNILRADGLGVTGCSRYGKGAFAIGVFDQRIALTMPIESGSAGAPIFRGIPGESGSQPLSSAYGEQPWLGDAFSQFTGNPANLPVDTHEMVAMVAPRGLFIMENPHIDWLAARSGSVAALGGAEVYRALGVPENITYWSDVTNGTHCANRTEWQTPLRQNIQKFLLKTGSSAGTIRISSRKAGNLAEWRDWTTPVLTDGPTPSPSTSPSTPTSPSPSVSPSSPGGNCTTSVRDGTRWADRFNTEITVSGTSNWTVVIGMTSPQQFSSAWNATATVSGTTVTLRPNGNGNVFGVTILANGNFTRPQIRSCTAT